MNDGLEFTSLGAICALSLVSIVTQLRRRSGPLGIVGVSDLRDSKGISRMKLRTYLLPIAVMLLAAVTLAAPGQRHRDWCSAAVASLPVFHEDVGADGKQAELDAIAAAVALRSEGAPLPPQAWASLILTVWRHESNLSSRIIAGNCKRHECDGGRARGGGQNHRNLHNATDWDQANGNVELQVKMTDDALRRAYWTCARAGVEPVAGTLSSYAGKRCGASWDGLQPRLATFNRLQRVTVRREGGAS